MAGLSQESVANVTQLQTIERSDLDDKLGKLPRQSNARYRRGVEKGPRHGSGRTDRGWPYGRYKTYNSYMIPVSEAREQLADLVNRVAYRHERITLGRRGKKIAAIVSAEDLDLLEALEDAADLRLIAEALADPANKRPPIPWSVVEAELAKRG